MLLARRDEFYLVVDGLVKVLKDEGDGRGEQQVATLGHGTSTLRYRWKAGERFSAAEECPRDRFRTALAEVAEGILSQIMYVTT